MYIKLLKKKIYMREKKQKLSPTKKKSVNKVNLYLIHNIYTIL